MSPESTVNLAITTVGTRSTAGLSTTTVELDAGALPFVRHPGAILRTRPIRVHIRDLHLAFPNHQTLGTRLVLTQSTYLLQKWIDTLREGDEIVATADATALEQNAPEAFQGRGVWRYFDLRSYDEDAEVGKDAEEPPSATERPEISVGAELARPIAGTVEMTLARAYASASAAERFRLCGEAVEAAPDSEVARRSG